MLQGLKWKYQERKRPYKNLVWLFSLVIIGQYLETVPGLLFRVIL